MKSALLALSLFTCVASGSDVYKLENLKRVSENLYQSESLIIQTRLCLELALSDSAILRYEGPLALSGSQLIFSSGTSCDVQKVIATNNQGTSSLGLSYGYVPGLSSGDINGALVTGIQQNQTTPVEASRIRAELPALKQRHAACN